MSIRLIPGILSAEVNNEDCIRCMYSRCTNNQSPSPSGAMSKIEHGYLQAAMQHSHALGNKNKHEEERMKSKLNGHSQKISVVSEIPTDRLHLLETLSRLS